MSVIIESISVYPIKSTQGHAVQNAKVQPRGLEHDRRWMLVDTDNQFITGRKFPCLLGVRASPQGKALHLQAPSAEPLLIDDAQQGCGAADVTVWRSDVTVQYVDDRADKWFSQLLGVDCRLVFMGEQHERAVKPDFALAQDIVSFADGYPLLLANNRSLADLNDRAPMDVSMDRFRPNVTISGADAYAEDEWQRIRLGDIEFDVPEPCSRCVMTTIDPQSLQPNEQREPLRTLSKYRNDRERGILFGMNLIPRGTGTLHVGDQLTVLK